MTKLSEQPTSEQIMGHLGAVGCKMVQADRFCDGF